MRIERTDSPGPTSEPDEPAPAAQPRALPALPDYDADLRLFAQNQLANAKTATDATSTAPVPQNDDILYVGMNASVVDGQVQCEREWKGISTALAPGHSTRIQNVAADAVTVNGQTFDLKTKDGVDAFVATLGMDKGTSERISKVLVGAGAGSKAELAEIAQVWARGEKGGPVPSRLVLSGHCNGIDGRVYDGSGETGGVAFADVQALAKAMPRAAAQIEDVMISGCHSGSKENVEAWQGAFPNLKTVWAYGTGDWSGPEYVDRSPTSAWAVAHIAAWEKRTRGHAASITAPTTNEIAFGADLVTVWSANGGYKAGKS